MNNKAVYIIILLVVLAGGGYYFYMRNEAKAPTDESNQYQYGQQANPTPTAMQDNTANPTPSGQTTTINSTSTLDYTPPGQGGEVPAPNIQVTEIDFDGSKFTPSTVNIKVNDYVFFKNNSSGNFWPASDPHPTHTDYPGFDALKPIAPGGSYKFQFTKVGNWGFHDHLNASIHGTVNVSQ